MTIYQIQHFIDYTYSQPVNFAPHKLRLRPRSNVHQAVLKFDLSILPTPEKLAGRFFSGYEAGAETDDRHLHAWVEIYLPGGGWRGYDPTHGLLVADDHIEIVSSQFPAQTTPVEGKLQTIGNIGMEMNYRLIIQKT